MFARCTVASSTLLKYFSRALYSYFAIGSFSIGHFLKRYSGLILEPPSFHSCPKTPCIMKWKLIKAPFNCSRQQFSGSGCKYTAWWLIVLKCSDQRNTHTWLNSFPWRLHPPANTIFPELVFRYFHNLCTDRKLNFPLKITADVSLVLSFTLETD